MSDAVIYLARFLPAARKVSSCLGADLIEFSGEAFRDAFTNYSRIVAVMATGIAVRCIAPLLADKWTDPAVVVVSPDLGYSIPLTGGHHGANDLARELAVLGVIPVITTATDRQGIPSLEAIARERNCTILNRGSSVAVNAALLDGDLGVYSISGPAVVIADQGVAFLVRDGEYTVGIGCRKDTPAHEVETAVRQALSHLHLAPDQVMVYATTEKKAREPGIISAIRTLGGTLIYIDDATIGRFPPSSPSRAGSIGLAAVAEPCALAASKKHELVLPKTAFGGVTVAIAR